MLKVALTGGIGCGKTTVCQLFSAHGVPVIDTDIIAREQVKPGQPALQMIVNYFGPDILLTDGTLNRKKLAGKTFSQPADRLKLESILHPCIRQHVQQQLSTLSSSYAIIAIPLLVETSQHTQYDRVLLVDCTEAQQIERTRSRDQRSREEIKNIINSQATREQRIGIADDILENDLDSNALASKVSALHKRYLSLAKR
ncbi:Dephospho-CoA kinase [hydrothermal vent metagenome]|uniref:Dephospho-CoA kinase n=1 Tax=hydrothermal vent metagenome TaxID=652676 RepID=A0A3B0X087_9ZZZZ